MEEGLQGTKQNVGVSEKCINNISNAEYRLNRMVLSHVQGCCYFCKHHLENQNIYFVTVQKHSLIQYMQSMLED